MEVDANQMYLITKYEKYTNSYIEKVLVVDRNHGRFLPEESATVGGESPRKRDRESQKRDQIYRE